MSGVSAALMAASQGATQQAMKGSYLAPMASAIAQTPVTSPYESFWTNFATNGAKGLLSGFLGAYAQRQAQAQASQQQQAYIDVLKNPGVESNDPQAELYRQLYSLEQDAAEAKMRSQPPKFYTIQNGMNQTQYRWDPSTGQGVPVGSGPKFPPQQLTDEQRIMGMGGSSIAPQGPAAQQPTLPQGEGQVARFDPAEMNDPDMQAFAQQMQQQGYSLQESPAPYVQRAQQGQQQGLPSPAALPNTTPTPEPVTPQFGPTRAQQFQQYMQQAVASGLPADIAKDNYKSQMAPVLEQEKQIRKMTMEESQKYASKLEMLDKAEVVLDEAGKAGYGVLGDYVEGVEVGKRALGSESAKQKLDAKDALRAVQNEFMLKAKPPAMGAMQAAEWDILRSAGFGVDKSPELNKATIQALKAGEENAAAFREFSDMYLNNYGPQGMFPAWEQYLKDSPIISPKSDPSKGFIQVNKNRPSWKEYFGMQPKMINGVPHRKVKGGWMPIQGQ